MEPAAVEAATATVETTTTATAVAATTMLRYSRGCGYNGDRAQYRCESPFHRTNLRSQHK
jgi:hypothetical protein